jgi:hypothetical protein
VEGGGSVTGSGIDCGTRCRETVADGTTVTLAAAPQVGWQFKGWTGPACMPGSAKTTCAFRMGGNVNAVAVFEQSGTPTASLSVQVEGSGSVSGGGIDCGVVCGAPVGVGATVVLTATPASGADFSGWKGVTCAEGTQGGTSCTFSVDSDTTAIAVFVPHLT